MKMNAAMRMKHGNGIHGLINYRATFSPLCSPLGAFGLACRKRGAPEMSHAELVRREHRYFGVALQ